MKKLFLTLSILLVFPALSFANTYTDAVALVDTLNASGDGNTYDVEIREEGGNTFIDVGMTPNLPTFIDHDISCTWNQDNFMFYCSETVTITMCSGSSFQYSYKEWTNNLESFAYVSPTYLDCSLDVIQSFQIKTTNPDGSITEELENGATSLQTTTENEDGSTTTNTTVSNTDGSSSSLEQTTFPDSTDHITKQTHISTVGDVDETIISVKTVTDEDGNTTEISETTSSSYDADGNLIDGEKTTVTTTDDSESLTPEKEEKEIYNPETGQWDCQATETSSCGGDTDDSNDPDNDNGDGTGGDSNGGGGGTPGCDEKTWYKDGDNDGYSNGMTINQCEKPEYYKLASDLTSTSGDECDDKPAYQAMPTWYIDADKDNYYPEGGTTKACEAPSTDYKASALAGDCDDGNKQLNPKTKWYKDSDYDQYGDKSSPLIEQCSQPTKYYLASALIATATDCNDGVKAINPGATEVCDTVDNNCYKEREDEVCCTSCPCNTNQLTTSSTNIASGNLLHDQPLTDGVTLYYNSSYPYDGSIGNKWSHSFEITLTEFDNGSVLYRSGSGSRRLYTLSGNGYTSQVGDYSTLSKDSDNAFVITEKDGSLYSFNEDGNIASIESLNSNTTTFSYESGHLASVTGSTGKTITFTSDNDGKVNMITDSAGNSYTLAYGGNGDLVEVMYPQADGATANWTYSYYENSFLETKTDINGYIVTYSYDESGRETEALTSEGEAFAISYTSDITQTSITRPDGGSWLYVYDLAESVLKEMTDPDGNVTSYEYDGDKSLISQTEPDGSTTSYTYDEYGNRTSETDAAGNTTSYAYNQYGQVLSVTDAEGSTSSYVYDDKGNLTSTTDASGASTSYEYDAKGNVTKITDNTGGETVMSSDDSNNLVSVRDTSGATTFFAYDDAGNMTGQTDANGNTITFEYNRLNQLVKVTDPQGKATSYSYDRSGNRTSQTDANGNITYYEYNHKGQVVKVTDALAGETKYTYGGTSCSACGSKGDNLTSITDAKGNTTKFEYDHLSRLVKEIGPLGYSTGYGYDAKGRLTSKIDAEGNTINYSYDALGRLLAKSYPDNAGESYSYNVKGNLLTAVNGNMGYTFFYDTGNRVTSVTDSKGRAISYSYDTSGRKTKMTGPNGEEVAYSYDESNRLNSIASDAEDFIFTYDSLGRRVGLSYPHGASASYSYDTSGRLTDLIHKASGGSVIASNHYSHDNVGNRLINESNTRTAVYQYDDIYRLNVANYTTPGFSTTKNDKGKGKNKGISNAIANQTEIYTYDPVGNRLTSQKNNTYSYNAANQLVMENGTTYIYDKNGNMIQKAATNEFASYFYNYENKLLKVERTLGDKIIIAEYKYDPFGRRVEKKVVEDGVATTTGYFYDSEDILFEYDGNGNIGNKYIHGPGIDEPLALIQDKGYYYYHADGLGSIVAITNSQEKVVQDYDYYYFGKLKNQKNRIKQPYTYTAREYDRETGLYYYRARYSDAELGRFTQKDPIGFEGGDENLYSYVQQNPVNWTDPSGLDRNNPCAGLEGLALWSCKKYVKWGCSGGRNALCCEFEKTECLEKSDLCDNDSDKSKKAEQCIIEYTQCMAGTEIKK